MTNELQIFNSGEFGEIRAFNVDGKPWFVGKDVAMSLGYADPTNAMKSHCRGVVKCHPIIDGLGRKQEVNIIPESDLYRLIMRSKLESAERFQDWVCEEVLPAIRKTGLYSMGHNDLIDTKKLQSITKNFQNFKKLAMASGLKGKAAIHSANNAVIRFNGVDCLEMIGHDTLFDKSAVDEIDIFLKDCCLVDIENNNYRVKPGELYCENYVPWCRDYNVNTLNMKAFNEILKNKFGQAVSSSGVRTYRGVKLIKEEI